MGRNLSPGYVKIGSLYINVTRFETNSEPDPTPNSDCILWTGATHVQGYGMMGYRDENNNKKMTVVHRLAKMADLGRELDSSEFVIHSCSNPKCINPQHLLLGDYHLRNAVMVANGRQPIYTNRVKVKGVEVKQDRVYKYSEAEIRWVRSATTEQIANKYNMTKSRAAQFRHGMQRGYQWLKD